MLRRTVNNMAKASLAITLTDSPYNTYCKLPPLNHTSQFQNNPSYMNRKQFFVLPEDVKIHGGKHFRTNLTSEEHSVFG